jgi:hypothetical protein
VKASGDRILYLARVLGKKLKDNSNLSQRADDETVRRAIVRILTESFKQLDAIEEKVEKQMARRKNVPLKDKEFLFARSLDDELRKRGA